MTTKADLVVAVANALAVPQSEAKPFVEAVFDQIAAALVAGNKVKIAGFGTFEIKETKERIVSSPLVGKVTVPAGRRVAFRPSAEIKERV